MMQIYGEAARIAPSIFSRRLKFLICFLVASFFLCSVTYAKEPSAMDEPLWSKPWIKRDDIVANSKTGRHDVYQDPRFEQDFVTFVKDEKGQLEDCWLIQTDLEHVSNVSCAFEFSGDVVKLAKRPPRERITDPWFDDSTGRLMGYNWLDATMDCGNRFITEWFYHLFGAPKFKGEKVCFSSCDGWIEIRFGPGLLKLNKGKDNS